MANYPRDGSSLTALRRKIGNHSLGGERGEDAGQYVGGTCEGVLGVSMELESELAPAVVPPQRARLVAGDLSESLPEVLG